MSELMTKIKGLMIEHLKMINSIDEIDDNAELTALGMDSMSATNLMIDIEDELDVVFPDELLTPETFFSPATLVNGVQGLLKESAAA
ncbi:MAG: acyl carrier protein [Arenicella sp.]|jgi:acyl carrier protein